MLVHLALRTLLQASGGVLLVIMVSTGCLSRNRATPCKSVCKTDKMRLSLFSRTRQLHTASLNVVIC